MPETCDCCAECPCFSCAIPERTEAQIKAEALREAADGWQWAGWAENLPHKGASRPELILGMAQRATDYLRSRAALIEGEVEHA